MIVDCVLKDGKIATSSGVVEAGLAIERGKIVTIAKEPLLPKADETVNVAGLCVLPGIIDAHVHVCDPGFIRESFETGTRAAAVGGVTTIVDMASSGELRTSTVAMLNKKKQLAERQSFVDFALYGGEISDERDLREISELVDAGVVGFGEIMMCGDNPIRDDETLRAAFELVSNAGSVAAVHAEDNATLIDNQKRLVSEGRKDIMAFADARPNSAEAESIRKTIGMSQRVAARLHICHLSTKEGVGLVRKAKKQGKSVTTEVCPHHLYFTKVDYAKLGPFLITTPPLRGKEDTERLWAGLADGTIDVLVSDHCAFTKREKDVGWKDTWATPPGVPGLESLASVMLGRGVKEGRISLSRFVQASAENPAKIFGLYPRKGSLVKGADADLTIVDLRRERRISADDLECVADYTPYDGWRVRAKVAMTVVRGKKVFEDGEIVGKMGYGEFIKHSPRLT